jgi:endonuclease/exonuclease/phosphatase family metal-dependent hydrolase
MNNNSIVKIVQQMIWASVKLTIILFLFDCLTDSHIEAQQQNDLRIMTFNIRYGTAADGENSWQFRKENVVKTILNFNPDLLSMQEALQMQIDELIKQMPAYSSLGVGRDDGKSGGEHSAIFYLKDRFDVDSSGTFWFSETPNIIASKSWGNNITRICTWARLHDKLSGKVFYIFNVHLDHESQPSREKSTILLMKRISEKTLPVILTGDFNCGDDNPAIKTILTSGLIDTYHKLHVKQSNEGTFNSFKGDTTGDKIDFIFSSIDFSIKQSEIIRANYDGKFPSDHFPVTAIIKFSR